ncbi:hypothetical protein [Deinococcus fonticola]|uniref:hypothetical protein n=1 Tax=Deinococcus fonticola TaxID=2528713 RepID=UPI00107520C2|nr:hypothetical protein [Deinococcus fonticola]
MTRRIRFAQLMPLLLGCGVFPEVSAMTPTTPPSQADRIQRQQGQGTRWWPSDTPGPRTPAAPTGHETLSLPTLDLLITLRLLRDQVKQGNIQPTPAASAALRELLPGLLREPALGNRKATDMRLAVLETLSAADVALLERQRVALEQRASLLLTRARIAAPDGPVNITEVRLGFMVPGGTVLVKELRQQPTLNPYRQAGANAALLRELLALLNLNR